MAQFQIYRSTDGSAPTLTGQADSLITLLDAILVNGYGALAAAGWSKAFSGTSKAVYQGGTGNQLYLRCLDDASGTAAGRQGWMTGYETMSDVDTGTGEFPTAAQGVGAAAKTGLRKSNTADAVARSWLCAADDRTIYLFVDQASTGVYAGFAFGEIYSIKSTADDYRTIIIGHNQDATAFTGSNNGLDLHSSIGAGIDDVITSHFMPRIYNATGTSVAVGKCGDGNLSATAGAGVASIGLVTYPNATDGGLMIAPFRVNDGATPRVRGRLRGLYHYLHPLAAATDGDTFSGVGDYAGKAFLLVKTTANSGVLVLETSDTLETN